MKKIGALYRIVFGGAVALLGAAPAAYAYLIPVHYNLTYLLSRDCGLSADESALIAWANSFSDRHPRTAPGVMPNQWVSAKRIEIRRLFHFPVDNIHDKVERNSPRARIVCELAIQKAAEGQPDPVLLGIGFHSFQDSFSHEDFGPILGHASSRRPDFPYLRPELADEMAEATWHMLDLWSVAAHGRHCSGMWAVTQSNVAELFRIESGKESLLNMAWKTRIEALLGEEIPEMVEDMTDPRVPDFEKRVKRVRDEFGQKL